MSACSFLMALRTDSVNRGSIISFFTLETVVLARFAGFFVFRILKCSQGSFAESVLNSSPGRSAMVALCNLRNVQSASTSVTPRHHFRVVEAISRSNESPDNYHMVVVVAAVVPVMPIWLRKCAGRKERKQDKY
jgi:hypothetical protein